MADKGMVLVISLLMLLSISILSLAAVSSSLMQRKMAMSSMLQGYAFEAAQNAVANVVTTARHPHETELDSFDYLLREARKQYLQSATPVELSCERPATHSESLFRREYRPPSAEIEGIPEVQMLSWIRLSYIGSRPCESDSMSAERLSYTCHFLNVRGCSKVAGRPLITVNTVPLRVMSPLSGPEQ